MIATLFISSIVFFREPFEFYISYAIIVFLLPFFIMRFQFPVSIVKIMLPLLIFGMFSVIGGQNTWALFMKIFINILISAMFYYYVFQAFRKDIKTIIRYYMIGATIVAVIGFIQLISYQIGFTPGYDFHWIFNKWGVSQGGVLGLRVNSVFTEPSYFGSSMGPAFFIAFYNLFRKKNLFIGKLACWLIIIIYPLSFSTIAYAGLFLATILFLINFGFVRYVAIALPVMIGVCIYLYTNVTEFRERVIGLDELYSGEASSAFDVHGSSFVQFNNFHVAFENFKHNPLFGTGLGSHPIAYNKYSLTKEFGGIYDFNKLDANSMALRLMSETGLFGLIFIFLFIIRYFVKRRLDNSNEMNWIVSSAMLVIIFLQLFRQGNYTYNGFLFFMWIYYFNHLDFKNNLKATSSQV